MKKTFLFSVGVVLLSTACGSTESDEASLAGRESALYGELVKVNGDIPCPTGYVIATPDDAYTYQSTLCGQLDTWDIARLTDSGAMNGPGYGCNIISYESSPLGHTLCKDPANNSFFKATGDSPCGPNQTLLTPEEASARSGEICDMLGMWDIVRLEGGGSMNGPGYGCIISTWDTQSLGHSLCKSLN